MPDENATIEELIEFWDNHSTADFEDQMEDVDIEFDIQEERYIIRLVPELAQSIGKQAKARGVSSETLINLWLSEKANAS